MRRHFQIVDCTRHLGLPIVLSCILLSLITGALNCFALYFLPDTWDYILMGYAAVTAIIGVLAALTGFRFFTVIYLLAESLCLIPIGVVIGYTSWASANYYNRCGTDIRNIYCVSWYTVYEWRLFNMDDGFLITGDCVACFSFVLAFTTLAGFRKLRLHQSGVATAVETRGHHHHHVDAVVVEERHHHHHCPPPAVVTVAQPTVMTVQQPTVMAYPAQNVIVQPTAPTLYPQLNNTTTYTAHVY